nr:prolipoprotein diacylglyceryl transferase [bacterium]
MDLTVLGRSVGAMAAAALALWALRRSRSEVVGDPFNDLLGAVLVGIGVGRLAYLWAEGVNVFADPIELILVRGGISPVPAAAGAVAFLAWTSRSDLANRMDYLAPAALSGIAVWEAGCLWQGACLGSPSELWWAMALPGSELTRHPVGLYAAVLFAVAAIWLLVRPLPWKGATAAMALGWAAGVRAIVPLWSVGGWSDRGWWYLAGVIVGVGGVVVARSRARGR